MPETWNGRSLGGCLFESAPRPAPSLNAAAPLGNLPQHVDLRAQCSPVEDQGPTNSCTANAVVGAIEMHQRKAGMPPLDMSRLFLYFNSRSLAQKEGDDCGSYIHHAMAALLAYGVCEERMWPFEKAMVTARPTDACFENATRYPAVQFARTPRGQPALAALAQGLPVAFGIHLPGECYKAAEQTGIMPSPDSIPVQSAPSGHAMLIVGYDMAQRLYIVRNSWGPGFGKDGYVMIPFDVMDRYSPPDQFWTIGAIEQSQGLSIFGPSVIENVEQVVAEAKGPSALDELRGKLRGELEGRLDTARQGFASRLRGK
jgi:hypothetical protein